MMWKLQVRGGVILTSVLVGASSIVLSPGTILAAPIDHTLDLRISGNSKGCVGDNEGWFELRFGQSRGRRRFASPTHVTVRVMGDGRDGFVSDIEFRERSAVAPFASRRRVYSTPTECTQVISDSAEIASEMMPDATQRPIHVPPSIDHRFIIDAPKHLQACNDPSAIKKWFELSRGEEQFGAPWHKSIYITFEGKLDERVIANVVLRGATGLPVQDANGTVIPDVQYTFHGPTECAQVIGHLTQNLTMHFWPPRERKPVKPFPLPAPPPPKLNGLGGGPIFQAYLVPEVLGMGWQTTYDRVLLPSVRLRGDVRIFTHLPFQIGSRGLTEGELKYLVTGSLAACYVWKVLDFCAVGGGGVTRLEPRGFASGKAATGPVAHGGALLVLETPPVYGFSFRLDAGLYLTAPRGIKATDQTFDESKLTGLGRLASTVGSAIITRF